MEFLDGRIFEDGSFPGVEAEERREMYVSLLVSVVVAVVLYVVA